MLKSGRARRYGFRALVRAARRAGAIAVLGTGLLGTFGSTSAQGRERTAGSVAAGLPIAAQLAPELTPLDSIAPRERDPEKVPGPPNAGGRLGRREAPRLRLWLAQAKGPVPRDVVSRIVRQRDGRFRLCHERANERDPKLRGRVVVGFVIERDGSLSALREASSDLPDAALVRCIVQAFAGLSFPKYPAGTTNVTYHVLLSPS